MKSFEEIKHFSIYFLIFVIILLSFILLYRSPYRLDDWTWGSSIGLNYLIEDHFSYYNGRYFSDIIVIILMRLPICIRVLIQLLVLSGITYYIYKIIYNKNSFCIFILLFLFIPMEIFSQTITWVSGFSNYAISVLFVVFHYNNCVNTILDNKAINKKQIAILSLLVLISQLILETTTIYLVFLYISSAIIYFILYKKISYVSIISSIFAVIGASIMFSNEAYRLSSNGNHGRQINLTDNLHENLLIYWDKFKTVIVSTWMINLFIPLSLVLSLYCYVLLKKRKPLGSIISILFLITFFTYQTTGVFGGHSFINPDIFSLVCLFFVGFLVFVIIYSLISRKDKYITLLCVLSQVVLVGPLIPVNPTMDRCFLQPYIHGLILICYMCTHINNSEYFKNSIRYKISFRIPRLSIISCFALIAYLSLWLYMENEACDIYKSRREEMNNVILNNKAILIQPCVPYSNIFSFGANLNDYSEDWSIDYKCFYGIPGDVNVIFVDTEEYYTMTVSNDS